MKNETVGSVAANLLRDDELDRVNGGIGMQASSLPSASSSLTANSV